MQALHKQEGLKVYKSVSSEAPSKWNTDVKQYEEVVKMYKMEAYRTEDKTLFNTEKSNNLEYFEKYKNRSNYKIKIFQKVKNKWKLIYSE